MNLWEVIKSKKENLQEFLDGVYDFNHPNRLATIVISGRLHYIEDQREFVPSVLSPARYEYTFDFSDLPIWERVFFVNFPHQSPNLSSTIEPELQAGQFLIQHQANVPWVMYSDASQKIDPSVVVVGTENFIQYNGDGSLVVSETTTNISKKLTFTIVSGGGHVVSGGKGAGGDDEKSDWNFTFSPLFSHRLSFSSVTISRLPWEEPWDAELNIFGDALAAWIAAGNLANGGGFSGTEDVEIAFGYDPPAEGALDFSQANQSANLILI